MVDNTGKSALCRHCGASALDCQHTFRATENWCCTPCRLSGPKAAHTVIRPDEET